MKVILFIVALTVCISSCSCEIKEDDHASTKFPFILEKPSENRSVFEKWQHIDKIFRKISNSAVKSLLPFLMDSSAHLNLSNECGQNVMNLVLGLKNIRPWAMRFLDSSGKSIDGIMVGSPTSFGIYDECVDTEVRSERERDKRKLLYRGQYCIINVIPPLPDIPKTKKFYKIEELGTELENISNENTIVGEFAKQAPMFHFITQKFGICVPTGCSLEDVNKIAKYAGNMISLNATAARCEVKGENEYTPIIIASIFVFSFLLFLMAAGTLIDLYKYYKKAEIINVWIQTVLAFSFFTNFQKLINTKTASGTLSCLNGIRFLTLSWVILGHTYMSFQPQVLINLKNISPFGRDFAFQAVINSTVSVETFFCMGGLLVSYLTVKLVRNEGQILKIGFFVFHRLWRLYPAYIGVILGSFLLNLFCEGPLWHEAADRFFEPCRKNWWTNLLFINNFYDAENMCIPQSWYIACDFQLYVGSLIFLLPMIRRPKAGILLTITAILACILYSGIDTYVNDYPPATLFNHPEVEKKMHYLAHFYFRPFVHVGPYCVGMLAGYILATYPKLKMPLVIQVIGWCSAITINMSVLYGAYEWSKGGDPSLVSGMMYVSFKRTAWSIGIAWMIVCCATGHGGVINYILSWKMFIPLGRLTYVTYLIHVMVMLIYMGQIKAPIYVEHLNIVYVFLGNLFIAYGGGFIGTMLIESPCMAIKKIFLTDHKRNSENTSISKNITAIDGTLGTTKNGDIQAVVFNHNEEKEGIDNVSDVYKV